MKSAGFYAKPSIFPILKKCIIWPTYSISYASLQEQKTERSFLWFIAGLTTVYVYLHYGQAHPSIAVLPGYQYDLSGHCVDVHA